MQLGIGQITKRSKSYKSQGLIVNSDDVFEKYLKDVKLDFKMQTDIKVKVKRKKR